MRSVDLIQPDGVGIPHRTAAIGRESVAVQINDVDVDGAQRDAFLENARALIHQGIDATVDDFFG